MFSDIFLRKPNTHKGDYGRIFIIAGSLGYTGAAILCANSAMRSGAGLVTLGIPLSLATIVAKRVSLEVMIKVLPETKNRTLALVAYRDIADFLEKVDILVIGPGLSRNHSTQKLVRKLISNSDLPLVLDADGLNALVGYLEILSKSKNRRPATILTPHPGEFSRLIAKPIKHVQENRESLAKSFADDYNTVLVLKGHKTVVASPDNKLYVNTTGNPGMSTAGSGDVLTGIIAAFLGQGLDGFKAAKLGVYLHGLAGDLAAEEKTQVGMIASDIIEKIPEAIKKKLLNC